MVTDERIAEIMQYARDVREGVQNPDLYGKRRMLEWLGVEVTIKDAHYYVTCLLGSTDVPIHQFPRRHQGRKTDEKFSLGIVSCLRYNYNWRIGLRRVTCAL